MAPIHTLRRLAALMASDPLSVRDIAGALGGLVEELPEGMGLAVQPDDGAFGSATIVPLPGSGAPYLVRLELTGDLPVTVADLGDALGPWVPMDGPHPTADPRIAFHVGSPDAPYTCTVLVDVRPGAAGVEDGRAHTCQLRRDPGMP